MGALQEGDQERGQHLKCKEITKPINKKKIKRKKKKLFMGSLFVWKHIPQTSHLVQTSD